METCLHHIALEGDAPRQFTYPFNYEPHPWCREAALVVQHAIGENAAWREDADRGKMFGVLIVEDGEGRHFFLAAYSGLLAGRNDWPFFVPPVYDAQAEDGYFKTHEREISAINKDIDRLENDGYRARLQHNLDAIRQQGTEKISQYKALMQQSKLQRDALRHGTAPLTASQEAALIRESQHQKAELRRIRRLCEEQEAEAMKPLGALQMEIDHWKRERKHKSDALQRWLFSQYVLLNARGERRDINDIFAHTPLRVAPAGTGDCCAPKLLQYAYRQGLRPVCMAEFWWGRSPRREIRHHLHFYPACSSKCKPTLNFMMQGLDVEENSHDTWLADGRLRVVYEDKWLVVVDKPCGMLSVPGNVARQSVVTCLQERPDQQGNAFYAPAHRLDMHTEGYLVVAKDKTTLSALHRLFAGGMVQKRYEAILSGVPQCAPQGIITLPLAADEHDAPRQVVDRETGKEALTEYRIEKTMNGHACVTLSPKTGRTHQLRVHCAHADGLSVPIHGDSLYGTMGHALCLRAVSITFPHPMTGETMTFGDRRHIWDNNDYLKEKGLSQ